LAATTRPGRATRLLNLVPGHDSAGAIVVVVLGDGCGVVVVDELDVGGVVVVGGVVDDVDVDGAVVVGGAPETSEVKSE
jgi:hypothetical protein